MTAATLEQVVVATMCPCGHRASLHGQLLRDIWCIAWNGSTFCGCQIAPARPQDTR